MYLDSCFIYLIMSFTDTKKWVQCDICGVMSMNGKIPHEPNSENCKFHQQFNDDHDTCGTYETTCPCHDCEVYFRKGVERPIIDKNISEEDKNDIIEGLKTEKIKIIMLSEWLRNIVFNKTSYPIWKDLNEKFHEINEKFKNNITKE